MKTIDTKMQIRPSIIDWTIFGESLHKSVLQKHVVVETPYRYAERHPTYSIPGEHRPLTTSTPFASEVL